MAKILSPVWSIIRGSIAGTTYTANTYHAIIARQRVSPIQPGTNYQAQVRASFAAANDFWKDLTQTVRDAWADWALTVTYEGPLGPYKPGARALFIGAFTLFLYGQLRGLHAHGPNTDPPQIAGLPAILAEPVDSDVVGAHISVRVTNFTDQNMLAYAARSVAFEETRTFWKGPWANRETHVLQIAPDSAETHTWPNLITGKRYFTVTRGITGPGFPHRMSAQWFLAHKAITVLP